MHSKYILRDQDMLVIGSANMDYRSFFSNYELMLFSKNEQLINQLNVDFESSLSHSELIESHHLQNKAYSDFYPSIVAILLRSWL